jgi:hypothetical protein
MGIVPEMSQERARLLCLKHKLWGVKKENTAEFGRHCGRGGQ